MPKCYEKFQEPLKIFHNKKFDGWRTCKSCGGKCELHYASLLREIFLGDMGYIECKNCGKKVQIP